MLLGIVYHSGLVYKVTSDNERWLVSNFEQDYFFNLITEFTHSFRMGAFYVISGFFFILVVEKYGIKKSLIDRLIRLSLPMVVVGITLNSLVNWLAVNKTYSYSMKYIIDGQWLGHLWFIGNLIIYYLLTVLWSERFTTKQMKVISKKWVFLIVIIVAPICSFLLGAIGNKVFSGVFFFITFSELYVYFPYYVLGMFLWGQKNCFFSLMTKRNLYILLFIAIVLKMLISQFEFDLILLRKSWTFEGVMGIVVYSAIKIIINIANTCIMMLVIGFLNVLGSQKNKLVSNLVESSYTVYLFHQPLILCLFYLAKPLLLNMYVSFTLLCVLTFSISFLIHFFIIKRNNILLFLFNGRPYKKTNPNVPIVVCQ